LSSFRLLSVMALSCRGLATITSCPMAFSSRLTQGECAPTSIAIRHFFIGPYNAFIAGLVVATLPSFTTSPVQSTTQYRLVLSPRSIPIVIGPFHG
jgi:hypothetical protein